MELFSFFLLIVCYACYDMVQAINNGWLVEKGKENVDLIRLFCKAIFFATALTPILTFIALKIL